MKKMNYNSKLKIELEIHEWCKIYDHLVAAYDSYADGDDYKEECDLLIMQLYDQISKVSFKEEYNK